MESVTSARALDRLSSGAMYEYKSWVKLVMSKTREQYRSHVLLFIHIRKWTKKSISLLIKLLPRIHIHIHFVIPYTLLYVTFVDIVKTYNCMHGRTLKHTHTDLKEIHSTSVDLRLLLIPQRNCVSGGVLWSGHVYTCLHATRKVSVQGKCVSHSLTRPEWPALSKDSTDRRQVRANSFH